MASKIAYFVDIVLVIDCTGSMRPVINRVKSQALDFHGKILARMEEKKKMIDRLRMRVIGYRDFWADREAIRAMPDFIDMETESEKFESFVKEIWADGGGDEPESGLEALALAIQSPWYKNSHSKKRNIIVVWTDASAHPLEKAKESPPKIYPENMPADLDELSDAWEELPVASRRLLLYAPDETPWNEIGYNWDQTIYFPSIAGEGLAEHDMDTILEAIANSI
ncbi:MAG: vWA domain-containing protein [Gammaproteobacteria bacterium]